MTVHLNGIVLILTSSELANLKSDWKSGSFHKLFFESFIVSSTSRMSSSSMVGNEVKNLWKIGQRKQICKKYTSVLVKLYFDIHSHRMRSKTDGEATLWFRHIYMTLHLTKDCNWNQTFFSCQQPTTPFHHRERQSQVVMTNSLGHDVFCVQRDVKLSGLGSYLQPGSTHPKSLMKNIFKLISLLQYLLHIHTQCCPKVMNCKKVSLQCFGKYLSQRYCQMQ